MTATIDITKIKADKSVKTEVLEVYTFLKIYMDAQPRQAWINRREKAWKAIENELWEEKEKADMIKMGQDPLPINKCNKGVQGSAAIVTNKRPEVKFLPIGSSDLYVAELLKRAHDVVWAKNDGGDVSYDVIEEAKIGGIGFFGAGIDSSKGIFGKVVFHEEPPDDIYWDENSRKKDLSDSHIIKAKLRTKSYIMETYDDVKEPDLYFEQGAKQDSGKSSGLTGKDNYAHGKSQTPDTQGAVYQEPENIWEIEAWMLKKVKEHWVVKIDGGDAVSNKMEFKEKVTAKQAEQAAIDQEGEYLPRLIEKRYRRIIVGKKLIEEKVNPFGVDSDDDPVTALIAVKHQRTRSSYPMSPTNYALPLNIEKIKRRAQFAYSASQNINAPIVEPALKTKWIGEPGTPGSRVEVDGSAAFTPTRLQSGAIDIGRFAELEALADRDIDDQYDLQDVSRGIVPKGQQNMSGRAVLALQDANQVMSGPFNRRVESAFARLGKIDMSLILRTWQRKDWERLLEDDEKPPDGTQEAKEDDQEDADLKIKVIKNYEDALEKIRSTDPTKEAGISLIDIDVRVAAGSSMPTNMMAKDEVAIERTKAGIYDAEAALEYTEDVQKDKIVARLKAQQQAAFNTAGKQ